MKKTNMRQNNKGRIYKKLSMKPRKILSTVFSHEIQKILIPSNRLHRPKPKIWRIRNYLSTLRQKHKEEK